MARRLTRIEFFTDGACPGNGQNRPCFMGAGIVGRSGPVTREWGIPLGPGTNQKAELLAVKAALEKVKDRSAAEIVVYTDSAYAIGCLTQNWKVKANAEIVASVRELIAECGRFEMEKVAGHAGVPENERADELAVRSALSGQPYSGED